MKPSGNLDLQERMKSSGNGNYVGKYMIFFLIIKVSLTDNWSCIGFLLLCNKPSQT